jgi:hypothetical protein
VSSLPAVRKVALSLVLGYLVLALISRAQEAAGHMTCDCDPDCWCRKRGLSLFRWVFPRFHHNPGFDASEKRRLEAGA